MKRIISAILSFVMLYAIGLTPAYAMSGDISETEIWVDPIPDEAVIFNEDSGDQIGDLDSEYYQDKTEEIPINEIISTLSSVERSKDVWGLTELNFENLCIGNPIYTYVYSSGSFTENAKIYPISNDNQLILLAVDYNGMITITTQLVETLKNIVDFDDPFTIIYDSYGCYILTDDSRTQVVEYDVDHESADLSSLPDNNLYLRNEIKLTKLADCQPLPYDATPIAQYTNEPYYYSSCAVPAVNQLPDRSICWAACVASIVNYRTGTNLTAKDVAIRVHGANYNQGYKAEYIAGLLSTYGVSYQAQRFYPTDYQIFINLDYNYPLYGRWIQPDGKPQHACLICGIDSRNKRLTLMDPMGGVFSIASFHGDDYYYHCIETNYDYYLGAVLLNRIS